MKKSVLKLDSTALMEHLRLLSTGNSDIFRFYSKENKIFHEEGNSFRDEIYRPFLKKKLLVFKAFWTALFTKPWKLFRKSKQSSACVAFWKIEQK